MTDDAWTMLWQEDTGILISTQETEWAYGAIPGFTAWMDHRQDHYARLADDLLDAHCQPGKPKEWMFHTGCRLSAISGLDSPEAARHGVYGLDGTVHMMPMTGARAFTTLVDNAFDRMIAAHMARTRGRFDRKGTAELRFATRSMYWSEKHPLPHPRFHPEEQEWLDSVMAGNPTTPPSDTITPEPSASEPGNDARMLIILEEPFDLDGVRSTVLAVTGPLIDDTALEEAWRTHLTAWLCTQEGYDWLASQPDGYDENEVHDSWRYWSPEEWCEHLPATAWQGSSWRVKAVPAWFIDPRYMSYPNEQACLEFTRRQLEQCHPQAAGNEQAIAVAWQWQCAHKTAACQATGQDGRDLHAILDAIVAGIPATDLDIS